MPKNLLLNTGCTLGWLVVIGVLAYTGSGFWGRTLGVAFFLPFTMFPYAISHIMVNKIHASLPRFILVISMAVYIGWFGYVYHNAFHVNIDPQSPIVLLFIGAYAAPVMAIFWGSAIAINVFSTKYNNPPHAEP